MVNGKMGHPNVLKLLDHYFTATHHVMILEFCSNDEFFDRISREGRMADQQARAAFRQIASGLHHIHSSGVAHLDMSLENVLIDHEGVYKICDFGMAREIKPEPSKAGTIKQGRNTSEHENDGGQASRNDAPSPSILRDLFADCEFNAKSHKPGKIGYQAPEIFRGLPFNGRKADVWSLGIILFITLVGAPPFTLPAPSDKRYRRVIQGQLCSLLRDWGLRDVISDDAVDLLNHMLCPIVNRYTLRQVLAHKWVTGQGDKEQLERLI